MKLYFSVCLFLCFFTTCFGKRTRNFDVEYPSSNVALNFDGRCNDPTPIEFQTLISHRNTIYVGATNAILQFSVSGLSLESAFVSGPDLNAQECTSPIYCLDGICSAKRTCDPNYSKLLIPYGDQLLACGSLFGACDLLRLSDLSMVYKKNSTIRCYADSENNLVQFSRVNVGDSFLGTIYVDETGSDRNIFYFTQADLNIALAPSENFPYFSSLGFIQLQSKEDTYRLAWTSGRHTYIMSTLSGKIRLVRFCNKGLELPGRSFPSYTQTSLLQSTHTQINLECKNNQAGVGRFVEAKFLSGKVYILFQSSQNLTLCSVSLTDINKEINFVREKCLNSTETSVAEHITGSNTCGVRDGYTEEWADCNLPESERKKPVNPISGLNPLRMSLEATMTLKGLEVSKSFFVTESNNFSSVFIGSSQGTIVKFTLGNGNLFLSETITLSGNEAVPLKTIVSDENRQNIFALTSNSVLKMTVADCERQYQTCSECLASMDAYCGWCVLENRCSRKTSCSSSDQEDLWLAPGVRITQCPSISNIRPKAFAAGNTTKVHLTLSGVKLRSSLNYKCQFSTNQNPGAFPESNLEMLDSNPQCLFSTQNYNVPLTADHENVTVNILYNGNKIASADVTVYECENIKAINLQTMCTSCASSRWGCNWCNITSTCSNTSCPDGQTTAADQCPVVTRILEDDKPISVGIEHTFSITTDSLYLGLAYTCHYDVCGREATSPASIYSATEVRCTASSEILSCGTDVSKLRVSIRRGSYIVDTAPSVNTAIKVFNCSVTSTDCSRCISFRRRFSECAWCNDRSVPACLPSSTCLSFYVNITQCSSPAIDSVTPLTSPTDGSTLVTISGRNLGSNAKEIVRILVAGVNCKVQEELYKTSVRIVCLTEPAQASQSGIVEIATSYSSNIIRSSSTFQYKNVTAYRYYPDVVLYSSILTIEGRNLNVGNKASVTFGSGDSATRIFFADRTSNRITCSLPFYEDAKDIPLTFMIDGYTRKFSNSLTFTSVPTYTSSKQIRAFRSGGGNVDLVLSSLDGVQTAVFEVGNEPGRNCTINKNATGSLMNSVTCDIIKRPSTERRRRQTGDSFSGVLILNGVHNISVGSIDYVDDPVLDEITTIPCDSSTASSTDAEDAAMDESRLTSIIQIPGQNFGLLEEKASDYTVILNPVGTQVFITCTVSYLTSTALFCNALRSELDSYIDEDLIIRVSIAELPSLTVQVQYCPSESLLAVYIAVPLVLILLLVIIVLVRRQQQRTKKQAEERKLVAKYLDDLENKTRETARNAYYELQLGYMNNLADNLTDRITYMAPELYFTQTLFNLARGHPVLDKSALRNQPTSTIEAIEEWMVLIKNRNFLLTFVKTLEDQKRFTVQEKGNVASLLTVCLFSDMSYYTSIMFDLLTELIHKHVQKNPKLLLRRSESVVEKMVSFWLSITLYDECIVEKSGKPIFLLAKAIHYLVNSAPCDVIALKAVNSLNESTLLSKELPYTNMTFHACIEEKDTGTTTEAVDVAVLNVDSITQTKMKIIEAVYKGRPYSELPKPDDLDLELHGGSDSKQGIILSDIDSVSAVVNNYKQINTLKHYNVPDNAHVILRPVGVLTTDSDDPKSPLLKGKAKNIFHLIHPSEEDGANGFPEAENGRGGKKTNDLLEELINKPLQEIYLTRMVKSKTTLQEYVEGVFNSILRPQPIPTAIRYFFQFLDREAARHKITDVEVIHIWKTNSLLLRYWVNVLKNPEFVFDINKTIVVDSCLNVITQAFMDACTTTSRKLGHDSPSNKLLYAKDAAQYKEMVTEFFMRVQDTPWLKEEDIDETLKRISQQYADKFNPHVASQQLYQYLFKYKEQMLEAVLEEHAEIVPDVQTLMDKMEGKSKSQTTNV